MALFESYEGFIGWPQRELGAIGIGLCVGLASLTPSRYVKSLFFGLAPNDPMAIAFSLLILSVAVLGACYLLARRAPQLDAIEFLRYD